MKNKKLFLRITTFIIALFTVILIGRINSNATQKQGPKIYCNTYYTIKDEKLINNKISAIFCNKIYDRFGNVDENLYDTYKIKYSFSRISLYIDDNEEPYKKYEIPTELFLSFENSGHTIHKGISCFKGYETKCDNTYEFDLTDVTIKESFYIEFYCGMVGYENHTYYKRVTKFTGYSLDGEIIIEQVNKNL